MELITKADEDTFIGAYIEAICFTENCTVEDLEAEFHRRCIIDALSFYLRIKCYLGHNEIVGAGHDFWLTRNGHGAGFWDGDWGTHQCALLTKISEGYGEIDVVTIDD